MKRLLLVGLLALAISFVSNAQFTFTVKPGLSLNGASFGFKSGNIVPYAGLQFLSVKDEYERDYQDNSYNDDYSYETSTRVFMPYLGIKYFMFESESLKASLNATVFKPFVTNSYKEDGVEPEDENDYDISIWGGELGFGSEYFFNEHFSIGGEFGFRYGIYSDEYKSETSIRTEDLKLNMTYVSASLNYYF